MKFTFFVNGVQSSRIHLEFLSGVGCVSHTILRVRDLHVVTIARWAFSFWKFYFEQYPRDKSYDNASRDFFIINVKINVLKDFVKIKSIDCHV